MYLKYLINICIDPERFPPDEDDPITAAIQECAPGYYYVVSCITMYNEPVSLV